MGKNAMGAFCDKIVKTFSRATRSKKQYSCFFRIKTQIIEKGARKMSFITIKPYEEKVFAVFVRKISPEKGY